MIRQAVPVAASRHSAILASLLFALCLLATSTAALAGGGVNTTTLGGLAVKGYDVVAYFTLGKAVKGSGSHAADWLGARWHFANEEHLDAFIASPAKYAPQYGGYCAGAVSEGFVADIDPEAWRIVEGRLYLLYSKDALRQWEKDIQRNIASAEVHWPDIQAKLTR